MRTYLFLALALTSACKWTDFDDLEDTTWTRSTQDPDIGSTDYAVAIAGVSSGTSGGSLAVISDDTANYSTVEYSAAGDADLGATPVKLGTEQIGAISETPVFAASNGRIVLVERSIAAGNFVVYAGSATAPSNLEFASASVPAPVPDAALFLPSGEIAFAAGNTIYRIPATGTPVPCTGTDNNDMPLQVAALGATTTDLWVWTKSGSLISYPLTDVIACTGGNLPAPGAAAFTPAGFMPAPGARMHISGDFAILTGHPVSSRSGSVFVAQLSTGTQVGTTISVEGLRTSELASLGGETYLVLGVPDRTVDGVAAGAVDLHAFAPTTGALTATPALTLHDAEAESGQLFGRGLATMNFNGSPILVVAGDSEVWAYYRTSLYDQLP